jgi:hypothetical protein
VPGRAIASHKARPSPCAGARIFLDTQRRAGNQATCWAACVAWSLSQLVETQSF